MTAQEMGVFVGRAIARTVQMEGLKGEDRKWTGLESQDCEQMEGEGFVMGTPEWLEAERIAQQEYERLVGLE